MPAPARRCTYLVYTCDRVRATTTGDTHSRCVSPVPAAPPRARLPHSCPRPRAAARISYTRVIVCAPPRRATHTGGAYRPRARRAPACPRASLVPARARAAACISYTRVTVCAPPRRATHTGGAYRSCAPRSRVPACLTRARPRASLHVSPYSRVTVCAPPRRATHTDGAYRPRARRAPACPLVSLVPARAPLHVSRIHV